MPILSSMLLTLPLIQGKWGECGGSCYSDMLLNGSEHCGRHTLGCVNSDDDKYGFTCTCAPGYTHHVPNLGEAARLVVGMICR